VLPEGVPDIPLGELQYRVYPVVGRVDIGVVTGREKRLVGPGVLFVPTDTGDDPVDAVCFEGVVQRHRLQEVVPDVRVEQERERLLLVLENVTDVVLVVFVERVDRDVVTGLQPSFLDVLADVLVAGVDNVDTPLVGPALDKVGYLVEVLEVVDKHRRRFLEAELVGNLVYKVKRQR
jgi:hypothetical protein